MSWKPRTTCASHKLRKGRVSMPGQMYLVTFATHDRRRLFDEPLHALRFEQACMDRRLWNEARLLAWVLMPDHWHGLIQLDGDATLSRTVQRLKANTARTIAMDDEALRGRIWQAGFHDRAIPGEKTMRAAADYLLANPLRAGLVESVGDWPWRYAAWE